MYMYMEVIGNILVVDIIMNWYLFQKICVFGEEVIVQLVFIFIDMDYKGIVIFYLKIK